MSREPFGDTIRRSRMRLGVTQRQLADLSTVSIRTIRDLEAARTSRPRGDTVRLISGVLGIGGYGDVVAHSIDVAPFDPTSSRPPPALGPTFGRSPVILGLSDEVRAGASRLVAIMGLAGVGKTRVAVEISGQVESAVRPVIWIPAATTRVPVFPRDMPALVVLDGWHPDDGSIGRLVELIRDCPHVTVLSTGRSATGLTDERVLALPPLAVPSPGLRDVDELLQVPSMRMLVGALRKQWRGFRLDQASVALLAELCRATDGIPALLAGIAAMVPLLGLDIVVGCARHDLPGLVGELLPELRAQIEDAVAALDPDEYTRIAALATVPDPWTVMIAAGLVDLSPVACAKFVEQMLRRGIVRPITDTDAQFQVLQLADRVIARRGPHPTCAGADPPRDRPSDGSAGVRSS